MGLLFTFLFVVLLFKLWTIITSGRCKSKRQMKDKVVVITGANRGIGLETARELAMRGAHVIMAGRDLVSGEKAVADVVDATGNDAVRFMKCDLASLASTRAFCEQLKATESHIDVLVCNAALVPSVGKVHRTEDGLELQMATNHFGHFLMVSLLLDLVKKATQGRVVIVSSLQHWFGGVDFDNINCDLGYVHPSKVYSNTKLANILFTRELAKRLIGTNVTVNAVHPGLVRTNINANFQFWFRLAVSLLAYRFAKTPEEGAQTLIYLAVAKEVESKSGRYFADCGESWLLSPRAKDVDVARRLWTVSEELTRLNDKQK